MSDPPGPSSVESRGDPLEDRPLGGARGVRVVFLLVNSEKQEVSFVFFTVNTRLIWLILLSMALGAALARFLPHWWRSRSGSR